MKSILNSCEPRSDIIAGTFNPEIFTASLSEVFRYYTGQGTGINAIYTDAEQFFTDGTYTTDGMRMVISEVFSRLSGDNTEAYLTVKDQVKDCPLMVELEKEKNKKDQDRS